MIRMVNNRRRSLAQTVYENDIYIKPDVDLSVLKDKLLYYPFSGGDWNVPILLFRNIISEFWFVDSNYSFTQGNSNIYSRGVFDEMKLLNTSFEGTREKREIEKRHTYKGEEYKYLHPGVMVRTYQYKDREITVKFRRGYDYTSLFGPSELDIAESRLGVFFLRGTSDEGGSNHLWFNSKKSLMLSGHEKISLTEKLIQSLPDGGLIVLDGSLTGYRSSKEKLKNVYQQFSPFFCNDEIPLREAMKRAEPFCDEEGNFFSCIGYAGRKKGPTLIWQVKKTD